MSQIVSDSATLSDYWSLVYRGRRLIAKCAAAGMVLALVWTLVSPPTYESRAAVVIRPIQSDPFASTRIEDVGASTELNVMGSTLVATLAAERLGTTDPAALLEHLTVTNPTDTLILDVAFSAGSPSEAQRGAQAFATSYMKYRRSSAEGIKQRRLDQIAAQTTALRTELERTVQTATDANALPEVRATAETRRGVLSARIGDLEASRTGVDATDTTPGEIIRPAELPTTPSGPGRLVTVLGGLALGLLAGVAIAIVRDRGGRHVVGHEDLVNLLEAEPLAEVPAPDRGLRHAPATLVAEDPAGRIAGEYRRLRARVWPGRTDGPRRTLIVTPTADTSADAMTANLALTIASLGWRVVVTWLDRGAPDQWSDAPLAHSPDRLNLDAAVADRLVTPAALAGVGLLPVLGRGSGVDPIEIAAENLAGLDGTTDIVLIVSDPALSSAQSVELAAFVDGVIVVFDPNTTTRAALVRTLETLATAKVLGVVAVNTDRRWNL